VVIAHPFRSETLLDTSVAARAKRRLKRREVEEEFDSLFEIDGAHWDQ
jgi:hypothetical protein